MDQIHYQKSMLLLGRGAALGENFLEVVWGAGVEI